MDGVRAMATKVLLFAALLGVAAAIYPDDHWSFSKKLTSSNIDDEIKSAVDGGKTMFAPAWNEVVREFSSNPNVVFGDVNLQDAGNIPGKFGAGQGGWPTVRYFNAETGYDGAPYKQKTSKSMCDELGDMEYMRAYVNEKGVPPCKVSQPDVHCSAKEQDYIKAWSAKAADAVSAERARLDKMRDAKGKADVIHWVRQRLALLKQLESKPQEL